LRKCS